MLIDSSLHLRLSKRTRLLNLPLPGDIGDEAAHAADSTDYENADEFNEASVDRTVSSFWLRSWEKISGADFTSVLESNNKKVDPDDDFYKTRHCVEEYCEFVDRFSMP